jgi:N-acetylmuramoyl-L-alanine amidase CwlA
MAEKPKIKKKLSKYNQQSRNGNSIKYIVIHYVGAVSSAKNNCIYFAGGDRRASAHFFVDKKIWQSIPLEKAAWHCGGGLQDTGARIVEGNAGATLHYKCTNNNSIGIELCCVKKKGQIVPSEKAIKTAIPLVKWLMEKYDVPASRVVRHFDVTGKHCPNGYISRTRWAELHRLLTGKELPKSKPYPTVTIQMGDKGEQVERLQKCLNKLNNKFKIFKPNLEVDGSFGPATFKAVKAFQKKYKLTVDGSVGPKTRRKIKQELKNL